MSNNNNLPCEWQTETDQLGAQKRYRMIGMLKEYEKMITVDGVEIPESELAAFHARNKAIKETKRIEMQREANNMQALKMCPFRANNMQSKCIKEECALYVNGCTLAAIGDPAKATANMNCPLTHRHCINNCALFRNNGCTLTAIKKIKER